MKIFCLLPLLLLLTVLAACDDGERQRLQLEELERMNRADSLVADSPTVALRLLDSCEAKVATWPEDLQMRFRLLQARAQNKAYVPFTSDSIMTIVANYYEKNGKPNERMEAHYLLGCVYRDLGEAPKALDQYQMAVDNADTTSQYCNYRTLMSIYGQMSVIFHEQNLPHDEISAINQYHLCAKILNDTLECVKAYSLLTKPYYLLGNNDSLLIVVKEAFKRYRGIGRPDKAAAMLISAIYIYTERGQYQKAKNLIDEYEQESGLFDKEGNIAKGREHYFYLKGYYYQKTNRMDSAEYYYRRLQKISNHKDAYRGLLAVYQQKQNMDSIAKFVMEYEKALDSTFLEMRTHAIHQMSSLYNYNRNQKIAEQERQKAKEAHDMITKIIVILLIVIGLFLYLLYQYKVYQKKKRLETIFLKEQLAVTKADHSQVSAELEELKKKNYYGMIMEKEQMEKELRIEIQQLQEKIKSQSNNNRTDRLEEFEKSKIVARFREKSKFKKGYHKPTKTDWKELIIRFSNDLPLVYERFCDNKLSALELRVCILLFIDITDH